MATSYAYVSPVVAVLLGGSLGTESLGAHVVFALAWILAGMALVLGKARGPSRSYGWTGRRRLRLQQASLEPVVR